MAFLLLEIICNLYSGAKLEGFSFGCNHSCPANVPKALPKTADRAIEDRLGPRVNTNAMDVNYRERELMINKLP